MAGIRAGVLLSAGLLTWLVAQGPLAPYRRALLDTTPPELVLVLEVMLNGNGLGRGWHGNWSCRCW